MKTRALTTAALMVAGMVTILPAKEAKTAAKGAKPAPSPGWLIVEEDVFTPLWFEPIGSLDSIRYHYRRKEEKAAANEISKAVSWLKLAENHAMPITKKKLTKAAAELTKVAKDLQAGKVAAAADLDAALGRAAQALGEWHYYKAKESWGKSEEPDAEKNLAMAAHYLQHAANSAHYEFGADTTAIITDYYDHGWWEGETVNYDHNKLGKDLQSLANAMSKLSDKLNKS